MRSPGCRRDTAAGLHGLELRFESGSTVSAGNPDGASHIARQLREQFRADPRLVIEDKGAGVALHWRQAPERAEECIAAMKEAAAAPEFEILRGHAVVEARPRGTNKGAALAALSRHGSFAGRRPVFVGDDVTDEDGFRAARAARRPRRQGRPGRHGRALPHVSTSTRCTPGSRKASQSLTGRAAP